MGIRIHKDIGYFIPIEKFENFIVKNYEEVMEEFDGDSEQYIQKMLDGYKNYKPLTKETFEDTLLTIMAKQYEEKQDFTTYNLVSTVCFGDDVVGIMVKTPELYKKCRYDDTIDYYEANQEDLSDTIKYLNQPIYPMQGYIYTGGLEEKAPKLKKGQICDMFSIRSYYLPESREVPENKKQEFVCHSGHFRPNIDAAAFVIAKEFGILEEHITEDDFNNMMEPVILTYWS
jgi:hypothetical protein